MSARAASIAAFSSLVASRWATLSIRSPPSRIAAIVGDRRCRSPSSGWSPRRFPRRRWRGKATAIPARRCRREGRGPRAAGPHSRDPPVGHANHPPGPLGDRRVVGDDDQARAARARALEQQVDDPRLRSRRRGCRSARRPAAAAASARWRARSPRAAARRPTVAPGNGSRDEPGRPPPVRRGPCPRAPSSRASSSGTATFSIAVIVGSKWNAWSTTPIERPRSRASRSSSISTTSSPSRRALPPVGRSSPEITAISELLPEPDGPRMASVSPSSSLRSIPRRISVRAAPRPRVS